MLWQGSSVSDTQLSEAVPCFGACSQILMGQSRLKPPHVAQPQQPSVASSMLALQAEPPEEFSTPARDQSTAEEAFALEGERWLVYQS